jgi:hypothetical protein
MKNQIWTIYYRSAADNKWFRYVSHTTDSVAFRPVERYCNELRAAGINFFVEWSE